MSLLSLLSSLTMLQMINGVYITLSAIKLTQVAVFVVKCRKSNTNGKKEGGDDMYTPSLNAVIKVLQYFVMTGQEHVGKIPRKALRHVTDRWIDTYNSKRKEATAPNDQTVLAGAGRSDFSTNSNEDVINNVKRNNDNNPPALSRTTTKTFYRLNDALRDFYMEFCDESSSSMVLWSKYTWVAFLNHPLGLVATLELFAAAVGCLFYLLRELLVKGGTAYSLLCKVAASATITEIYVVSRKENITFDTALHKYPWVAGLFSRRQLHPMIGKAVCPVYKRTVEFAPDTMDFEIEVLPNDSGLLVMRQSYASDPISNILEDLVPAQVVLAAVAGSVYSMYGIDGVGSVASAGLTFYILRTMADSYMGIRWLPMYLYMP